MLKKGQRVWGKTPNGEYKMGKIEKKLSNTIIIHSKLQREVLKKVQVKKVSSKNKFLKFIRVNKTF